MSEPYEGFAIVELMGHRRLAGWVSQAEMYGTVLLRLDVPATDGTFPDVNGSDGPGGATFIPGLDDAAWAATQFYGGSSIYCITPCSRDAALLVAARDRPAPIQQWELPRPAEHDVEDAEVDEDDVPWE